MAFKLIKCKSGAAIQVDDRCGLAIRIEDDEGAPARAVITADEARSLARALDAFAEIYEPDSR